MPTHLQEAVEQLMLQYDQLLPSTIDQLLQCYSTQAVFKDPFQEVTGHAQIKHIFLKMFAQLSNPQFKVHECLMGQNQVAFLWDFTFAMRRWNTTPQSFSGVSWLTFDEQFLVIKHHDYWDPAAGIYEHLPIIGPIMRGLKSRA